MLHPKFKTVNPIVIGFTGYKQSGKNTVASSLGLLFATTKSIHPISDIYFEAFAKGVKQRVADAFGIDVKTVEDCKQHPLVRRVLQYTGTEWGREEDGQDVWVKDLASRVQQLPLKKRIVVIITDVRFINEAEWIKKQDGCLVRIEREGLKNNDLHQSEVEIDKIQSPDFRLYNDGKSFVKLNGDVKVLFENIKERYGID